MANNCVSPTIQILRYNSDGELKEDYTSSNNNTYMMNCRLARIGGCWDASFNVIRQVNHIGTLQTGDMIFINYSGTRLWRGWVDSYESKSGDLEVKCVGAWKALKSLYPDNKRFGSEADSAEDDEENEYSDLTTSSVIIQNLINDLLATSDITLEGGIDGSDNSVYVLDVDGTADLLTICADLAERAGNWSVGVNEHLIFYLTDPGYYNALDFKACEGNTYRITDMDKVDSTAWTDMPTSIVIKGAGGYEETFDADWLGYEKVKVAGIDIVNRQVITLPHIGPTEESTYSTQYTGWTLGDVVSVDAAAFVDQYYHKLLKQRFRLTCENLNQRVYPWVDYARVWDVSKTFMGSFLIDMVEYESRSANISIKTMEISDL